MHDAASPSPLQIRNGWVILTVSLVGLVLLPLFTRALLNHPPEYDELLHVLAARGVNTTGEPAIADGLYLRAEGYTRLIAQATRLGGDELTVARLPALIAGMLLVALVGGWVSARAGWLAGLVAVTVLATAPQTLHLSVLVRFYTLHCLVVTSFLILAYEALCPGRSAVFRLPALIGVVGLFFVAWHLHELTLISAGAGIVALLCVLLFDVREHYLGAALRHKSISMVLLVAVAAIGLFALIKLGIVDQLRGNTPAWSVDRSTYYGFYLGAFGYQMPFIWPLFPIMATAAFFENRRLALFCLVVIVVALVANSVASQKAMRYVYHFVPMICVLWGIGFQKIVETVVAAFSRFTSAHVSIGLILVLALSGISVANTAEFKRTLKLLMGRAFVDDTIPVLREPDWLATRPQLAPLAASADTVIVTSGVKGLYTFGRYDYELSATVVEETESGTDFGLDARTGRQVISSVDAVGTVLDAPGSKLIVLENRMLNTSYSVTPDVVSMIEERCVSIALPEASEPASQLRAWRCDTP